ncbi:uncharacterized protein LOC117316311 [Pecten maximus]|uniref:uncharacterized protein LOC117316311 n=1 Tax=Pecten maximus TaxID=6579 RepID=UPI00145886C9|nr:uncharacterized protein LOC117316311 [Pecten maximus]
MVERHVDLETLRRSVRLHVSGPRRNSVTRFEVLKALLDIGVPGTDILSVFRCEAPNTWFSTVTGQDMVNIIVSNGMIRKEQFALHPEPCDQRRLTIRVQWLPTWIDDNCIANYFETYGKVINFSRETSEVAGVTLETGTREITLLIREGDQDDIPHKARMFGKTALIMVPGRPPICLRCHQVGHVRSQCPGRPVQAASYASKVAQSGPAPQPSSENSVTASPSAGGSGEPVSPSQGENGEPVTVSPSAGGSGVPELAQPQKRQVDDDGFQIAKKGKHHSHSPIVMEDGNLAPGQRTPDDQDAKEESMDEDEGSRIFRKRVYRGNLVLPTAKMEVHSQELGILTVHCYHNQNCL